MPAKLKQVKVFGHQLLCGRPKSQNFYLGGHIAITIAVYTAPRPETHQYNRVSEEKLSHFDLELLQIACSDFSYDLGFAVLGSLYGFIAICCA